MRLDVSAMLRAAARQWDTGTPNGGTFIMYRIIPKSQSRLYGYHFGWILGIISILIITIFVSPMR